MSSFLVILEFGAASAGYENNQPKSMHFFFDIFLICQRFFSLAPEIETALKWRKSIFELNRNQISKRFFSNTPFSFLEAENRPSAEIGLGFAVQTKPYFFALKK